MANAAANPAATRAGKPRLAFGTLCQGALPAEAGVSARYRTSQSGFGSSLKASRSASPQAPRIIWK
jgi:hypothetical protein